MESRVPFRWTHQLRVDYANYLAVVLLAVDRAANREVRRQTTGVDAARQAQLGASTTTAFVSHR